MVGYRTRRQLPGARLPAAEAPPEERRSRRGAGVLRRGCRAARKRRTAMEAIDLVVVGGGVVGLSCAREAPAPGAPCA